MKTDFFSKLKEIKGIGYLLLILVIGICLIIVGVILQGSKKNVDTKEVFYYSEYEKELEDRVVKIVSQVGGVCDVSVMVTLDSSVNYSYAENDKGTSSEYVTVRDKDGNESGVLISENTPEIRGIAVVCTGGDDPGRRLEIINLISALLSIPKNRIYVGGK